MSGLDDFPRDGLGRVILPDDVLERFWEKVDRRGEDECWEWIGTRTSGNYGALRLAGTMVASHRIAFALRCGAQSAGLLIHHDCHNRSCCNPRHLHLVTPAVNARNRQDGGDSRPVGYKPTPTKRDHVAHFWRHVDRSAGDEGCWPWTGSVAGPKSCPHGRFKYDGNSVYTHRFAWELANNRSVPDGLVVRHACDNPICQNPSHLVIGTQSDNVRDALIRGRWKPTQGRIGHFMREHPERRARGDQNGSRTRPDRRPKGDTHWSRIKPVNLARGERNGMVAHPEARRYGSDNHASKLTEDQKAEIRDRRRAGERCVDLAAEFGVTAVRVSQLGRLGH